MKRKAAFVMAVSLTLASVFGESTAVFAQETGGETGMETTEVVEMPETGTEEAIAEAAEDPAAWIETEEAEAVSEDEGFADKIIEDPAEDFTELPQQPEFSETGETNEVHNATMEDQVGADAELTIDLTSDAAGWIEVAPTEASDAADDSDIVATLDASCFPDVNFCDYISEEYDKNSDGMLSRTEAENVIYMFVDECGITDLKGIEFFPNMRSLYCSSNQLTSLDVSKNTALTYLSCWQNQLTSLDVSKNTNLENLSCFDNQLTSLDVSKNSALTDLSCSSNQLTSLDVSKNTTLTYLSCWQNQLTSLDVSKNTALTDLNCDFNQLTSLDVSKNSALTDLSCYSNQLTSLDVSKNTALTDLSCGSNQLTSLDVSKNSALKELDCCFNQLTTLILDTSEDSALESLNCEYNALAALAISSNTQFDDDEEFGIPCIQNRTAPLKDAGSGWLLDMAELVGKDNLHRIILDSGLPKMSSDGTILFQKNALPDEICYEYVCTEGNHLIVHLAVEDKLKAPNQTEKNPQHTTHSYGSFKTVKEPTVLAEGVETRTCTVCGAAENRAVAKLKPTMELNATSIKLKTKQSTNKIEVSGLARGDEVVSWKSDKPKIATVNKNGKITAKAKKGKATITVTLKSGFSKKIKVTVQKEEVACTKVTLNKKSVTLKKGKKFTLKPTIKPITCIQKARYTTSNQSVATVSGKGVIKAKKKGTATITVSVGKKKVKCTVKVK